MKKDDLIILCNGKQKHSYMISAQICSKRTISEFL
jgi:hypothetical protein